MPRPASGPELVTVKHDGDANLSGSHHGANCDELQGRSPIQEAGPLHIYLEPRALWNVTGTCHQHSAAAHINRLSNSGNRAGRSHGLVTRIQLERISRFNPAIIVHVHNQKVNAFDPPRLTYALPTLLTPTLSNSRTNALSLGNRTEFRL